MDGDFVSQDHWTPIERAAIEGGSVIVDMDLNRW